MSDADFDDVEIEPFLESDESVDDLLKSEYSPRDPDDEFFADLQPKVDVREEDPEVEASPDARLIRGKGVALTDIESDEDLAEEISKEEETVALHSDDEFADAALNAVYKSTVNHRAARERAEMDKRELLDLAGDVVDDYFRKHVTTDGIEESKLNRIKFAARQRIADSLAEE